MPESNTTAGNCFGPGDRFTVSDFVIGATYNFNTCGETVFDTQLSLVSNDPSTYYQTIAFANGGCSSPVDGASIQFVATARSAAVSMFSSYCQSTPGLCTVSETASPLPR